MKVKNLIEVLQRAPQDLEVTYNGEGFQDVDFINIAKLDFGGTTKKTFLILNDQYQERFVKEGKIIPLVEKQLTKENIESISTEGDTKILKLSGFNYQDLGFLKPGDIEIRLLKGCDPCVVCKDKESNYFESKRIYCIFSQEVINFIKTFN